MDGLAQWQLGVLVGQALTGQLPKTEPPNPTIVCAWCPDRKVMQTGTPGHGVSHGICPECEAKLNREMDGRL